MANVIDSLVLSLSLDPSQFIKGGKDAAVAFTKTKDEAIRTGKQVEEASKKMEQSLFAVTRQVLGLFAVLTAGRGFKELIADVNASNAALGRFSANLGQAPQAVSALQAVVERVGGTAADANTALEAANKTIQDFLVNGKGIPEVLSRMTAQVGGRVDFSHGPLAYLKTLAPVFQRLNAVDPAKAHAFMQELGIPDSVANAMAKYGDGFGKVLDGLERLAPTATAIKGAQDLQTAWATVTQEIEKSTSDLSVGFNHALTGTLDAISAGIEKIRLDPAVASNWAKLSGDVDKLMADINLTPTEGGFVGWLDKQVLAAIKDVDDLITHLDKLLHFIAPTQAEVVKDMQAGQDAGPFDVWKWLRDNRRDTSKDDANKLTPEDRAKLGAGRGFEFGGGGKDIGSLERATDSGDQGTAFPLLRSGDAGRDIGALPLKIGSTEVSAGNPLPVRIIQGTAGGTLWDWLTGGSSGGGGGTGGDSGSGGWLSRAVRAAGDLVGGGAGAGGGGQHSRSHGHGRNLEMGGDPTGEGGGTRGQHPTGKWWTPERMAHAAGRLMKEGGLSEAGAAGLVARWSAIEAAGGPTSRNPNSGAQGIAQWLGSRKRGMGATFDEQLSHAIDELHGDESKAARVLRNAKTAREGSVGASMYERAEGYNPHSGTDNFTNSTPTAKVMATIKQSQDAAAPAPPPPIPNVATGAAGSAALSTISNQWHATTDSSINSMHIGAINVNAPAAVDANGVAKGIQPALSKNYFAQFSNSGPM